MRHKISKLFKVNKAIPIFPFDYCRMRFLVLGWSVGKEKEKQN